VVIGGENCVWLRHDNVFSWRCVIGVVMRSLLYSLQWAVRIIQALGRRVVFMHFLMLQQVVVSVEKLIARRMRAFEGCQITKKKLRIVSVHNINAGTHASHECVLNECAF
jgi:hypothetical protein